MFMDYVIQQKWRFKKHGQILWEISRVAGSESAEADTGQSGQFGAEQSQMFFTGGDKDIIVHIPKPHG